MLHPTLARILMLITLGTTISINAYAEPASTINQADSQALSQNTKERLDSAWQGIIDSLKKTKETLDSPEHFSPPATDRGLAEGYRYALAHLNRAIEFEMRADPKYPEFFRSMDMLRKWTGENPDTLYLKAPIDSSGYYKITGKAANTKEWRTSQRGVKGPKAPRLVTFQTITDVPGHTGEMAEMANCKNQTLDFTNGLTMEVDRKGRFEILVGPERPEDYKGNFLFSKKLMKCPSTQIESVRHAKWLALREMFSDWKNEVPLELEIVRLDSIGRSRPPITVDQMIEKLENIATEVPNQVRFWNLILEFPMELRRDANNDGVRNLPVNGINKPAPPFTAGGVAGSQQIYASGTFDLANDEALVIKITAPVEPYYIGFQLNNYWMEGPDQQNYVSSLTGHQLPVASDGSRYYIISHQDPGYRGWVATTGLVEGFHGMRFVFKDQPEEALLPTSAAFHVKLAELATVIPQDTPKVTTDERRQEIAIRQQHIKLRWRGH